MINCFIFTSFLNKFDYLEHTKWQILTALKRVLKAMIRAGLLPVHQKKTNRRSVKGSRSKI